MRSYYAILEIQSTATSREVKQAFRRLSKLYHPDMNLGDTSNQHKLFEVIKAYEVLGNEIQRKAYDLTLFRTQSESTRTAYTTSSTYANATESSSEYYKPKVMNFSCNQTYFFIGDRIEITWECENANVIRIHPLGYMDELKGKIVYRVKEMRAKQLFFELIVTNNYSQHIEKRTIKLENGAYKKFTEANGKDKANYENPHAWSIGFLAPVGRSSRKDYALRMLLLGSFFLAAYFYQPFFEHEGNYSFICTVLIYLSIICSARRLHDLSWHGIVSLLLLIPILNLALLVVLFFLKGVELPNKYGRKPKS